METSGEWMSSEMVLTMGWRVTEYLLIHRYDGQLRWGKHNRSTLITETDDLVGEENTRSNRYVGKVATQLGMSRSRVHVVWYVYEIGQRSELWCVLIYWVWWQMTRCRWAQSMISETRWGRVIRKGEGQTDPWPDQTRHHVRSGVEFCFPAFPHYTHKLSKRCIVLVILYML